jgi:hypothetical protein
MIRRSVLDAVGVYSTAAERQPPEDFELWSRIARHAEVANLPERLVIYRETPQSMSRVGPNPFLEKLILISSENLWHMSGQVTPMRVCTDAAALFHGGYARVSPDCDIGAICRVVEAATTRIEADNPGADLGEARARLIGSLRHHHGACRGTGLRHVLRRMPVIGPLGRRVITFLRNA